MSGVSDLSARVLTVLEAEEQLYLEMRELLQAERESLLRLDATGIEEAVRGKESLAAEGRFLEETRLELARALGLELGLPEERPKLSILCARMGSEAGPLREAHSRLVALIGAVRELLDANSAFAGDALLQVRSTLQLLGRLIPADPTYGPQRATSSAPSGGSLVSRSA